MDLILLLFSLTCCYYEKQHSSGRRYFCGNCIKQQLILQNEFVRKSPCLCWKIKNVPLYKFDQKPFFSIFPDIGFPCFRWKVAPPKMIVRNLCFLRLKCFAQNRHKFAQTCHACQTCQAKLVQQIKVALPN